MFLGIDFPDKTQIWNSFKDHPKTDLAKIDDACKNVILKHGVPETTAEIMRVIQRCNSDLFRELLNDSQNFVWARPSKLNDPRFQPQDSDGKLEMLNFSGHSGQRMKDKGNVRKNLYLHPKYLGEIWDVKQFKQFRTKYQNRIAGIFEPAGILPEISKFARRKEQQRSQKPFTLKYFPGKELHENHLYETSPEFRLERTEILLDAEAQNIEDTRLGRKAKQENPTSTLRDWVSRSASTISEIQDPQIMATENDKVSEESDGFEDFEEFEGFEEEPEDATEEKPGNETVYETEGEVEDYVDTDNNPTDRGSWKSNASRLATRDLTTEEVFEIMFDIDEQLDLEVYKKLSLMFNSSAAFPKHIPSNVIEWAHTGANSVGYVSKKKPKLQNMPAFKQHLYECETIDLEQKITFNPFVSGDGSSYNPILT